MYREIVLIDWNINEVSANGPISSAVCDYSSRPPSRHPGHLGEALSISTNMLRSPSISPISANLGNLCRPGQSLESWQFLQISADFGQDWERWPRLAAVSGNRQDWQIFSEIAIQYNLIWPDIFRDGRA
jgi:hypothetical protein